MVMHVYWWCHSYHCFICVNFHHVMDTHTILKHELTSMNEYLITVSGMFTTTCVDRAMYFYRHLVKELLEYASAQITHLTAKQAHVMWSFDNACTNMDNAKRPITEFQKRAVLQKWKTILNQLIQFYENTELNGPDVPEIVKWRWAHMGPRAKSWQTKVEGCDWAYCRAIYPPLTGEPWWHGAEHVSP